MKTGMDRYYSDPVFHQLVDVMVAHIINHNFTPSEMRDAAMCASIKFESENVRPMSIMVEAARLAEAFPELLSDPAAPRRSWWGRKH